MRSASFLNCASTSSSPRSYGPDSTSCSRWSWSIEASIDQLQREQEVESGPYERGLEEVEAQFKKLADRIADARIAKAERQSRLQVGGLAPLPHESIGRNVPGKVGFAGLVGLCLSLVAVWLFAKGRG